MSNAMTETEKLLQTRIEIMQREIERLRELLNKKEKNDESN